MPYVLLVFYPTASATVYGQRPKFFRAEHSATAEGENWAYGPTLVDWMNVTKMHQSAVCSQSQVKITFHFHFAFDLQSSLGKPPFYFRFFVELFLLKTMIFL